VNTRQPRRFFEKLYLTYVLYIYVPVLHQLSSNLCLLRSVTACLSLYSRACDLHRSNILDCAQCWWVSIASTRATSTFASLKCISTIVVNDFASFTSGNEMGTAHYLYLRHLGVKLTGKRRTSDFLSRHAPIIQAIRKPDALLTYTHNPLAMARPKTLASIFDEVKYDIRGKVILTTGVSPSSLGSAFVVTIAQASPALLILAGRSHASTVGTW